jgi:tRNA G18 (ribose-2'-O)-methylase SpoU
MTQIVVIAHDIRSAHNVGSLLRTADGFGARVYLTGYTPYPQENDDSRLPHIAQKLTRQISKTALGAEADHSVWQHDENIETVLALLKADGYELVALEQSADSIELPDYRPSAKVAILIGREVEGLDPILIKSCHKTIEIPMLGKKESFNVIEATTVALYHCRFIAA